MSGFKTHSPEEIQAAIDAGKEVYALDTGNDGEDNHFIGPLDDIITNLCHHYEIDRLPDHWSLDRVDWNVL